MVPCDKDQDPLCSLLAGLTVRLPGPPGKEATAPAASSPFPHSLDVMPTPAWSSRQPS